MTDEIDPIHRESLVAFLKDRDVYCPLCEYNLRDLPAPVCPECGKTIELAVKARDVDLRPWAIMTAALSMAAGVGVLFVYMVIRQGMPSPSEIDPSIIYAFMATIPFAMVALICRRRFIRLKRHTQHYLAGSVVGTMIVLFVFILGTMD